MIADKNITVSSGVTRVPGHLRITPTMVDDFLIDPVMGIYVIFGVKLDVFQQYAVARSAAISRAVLCRSNRRRDGARRNGSPRCTPPWPPINPSFKEDK